MDHGNIQMVGCSSILLPFPSLRLSRPLVCHCVFYSISLVSGPKTDPPSDSCSGFDLDASGCALCAKSTIIPLSAYRDCSRCRAGCFHSVLFQGRDSAGRLRRKQFQQCRGSGSRPASGHGLLPIGYIGPHPLSQRPRKRCIGADGPSAGFPPYSSRH